MYLFQGMYGISKLKYNSKQKSVKSPCKKIVPPKNVDIYNNMFEYSLWVVEWW